MGNTRPESSLAVLAGDMRGGTSGSIYRGQRTGEKMGGKKQTQSQARRDSDGTLRGSVHGNQGGAESATDSANSTTTTQDVYQSIRSTVPSNAAMIPPPPTDILQSDKQTTSVVISRKQIELRSVLVKVPAMAGLDSSCDRTVLNARLNLRETNALKALVEGYDSDGFQSPANRSANGQDWIRYVLNAVADELGL